MGDRIRVRGRGRELISLRLFLLSFLINVTILGMFWHSKVDFLDVVLFGFLSSVVLSLIEHIFVTQRIIKLIIHLRKRQEYHDPFSDEVSQLVNQVNDLVRVLSNQVTERDKLRETFTTFIHDLKSLISEDVKDETFHRMLDEYYEFAKLETGIEKLKREPINLVELVWDAVGKLEKKYQKNVEFSYQGERHIEGDPMKLFRAIYNVLENAVKYATGRIVVRVGVDRVTVESEGEEIPYEVRANLFEKAKKAKGTGIGLYIARRFLEMHGFRIVYRRESNMNVFEIQIGYTGMSSVKGAIDSR